MGTNSCDINWAALRHEWALAKKFAFCSPRNSRSGLTPPPAVCDILSSETQIKSLLFNNNIASLDTTFIIV